LFESSNWSPKATNIIAWRETPGRRKIKLSLAVGEQPSFVYLFDADSVRRVLFINTYGFTIGGEAVLFVIFDDKS
jgi:hypothetical protein